MLAGAGDALSRATRIAVQIIVRCTGDFIIKTSGFGLSVLSSYS